MSRGSAAPSTSWEGGRLPMGPDGTELDHFLGSDGRREMQSPSHEETGVRAESPKPTHRKEQLTAREERELARKKKGKGDKVPGQDDK